MPEKKTPTKKSSVQYRVKFAKNDEVVEGPDDAFVVVSCSAQDAVTDPTVAFMQGRLKATGNTGELFAVLISGEAAAALSRLASRP